jgi:hypothetical protein
VIALTDHNAATNLPCAMEAGRALGVAVIPGMEVTSKEEVHVLAYFPALADALAFGDLIYAHLPNVQNDPSLFGRQIIMKDDEEPGSELDRLLISATDFTLDHLTEKIEEYHGIAVPAHINRGSNGILGALGLMPALPLYPVVEVSPTLACPGYAVKGRLCLHSSDAHRLCDIQERDFSLEAEEKTAEAVCYALRREMQGGK